MSYNDITVEKLEIGLRQYDNTIPDDQNCIEVGSPYDNKAVGTTYNLVTRHIGIGNTSRYIGSQYNFNCDCGVSEMGWNITTISPVNTHYCLVRFPVNLKTIQSIKVGTPGNTSATLITDTYGYFLMCNVSTLTITPCVTTGQTNHYNRIYAQGYSWTTNTSTTNIRNTWTFTQIDNSDFTTCTNINSDVLEALNTLKGNGYYVGYNGLNDSAFISPFAPFNERQNATVQVSTELPRFDYTQIDDIKNFLQTGDTSHAIYDDETPETPYKTRVDNVATHVVMYCDKDVIPTKSAFEVSISNGDVDQMPVSTQRLYFMENYIGDYGETQIGGRSSYRASRRDVWGDITPISGQGNLWIKFISTNPLDDELEFGRWWLRYRLSETKASGIELLSIPSMVDRTISQTGTITTDTYTRFTYSDGSTFTIYFYPKRDEETDDGFIHKPNGSGTDSASEVDILDAYGIGTYNIGSNGLSDVNRYLWGNSWATLFQAINPITCITSCKQIPFNKSGNAVTSIPIANKTCDVSASKINPVGVFNVMSNATISPLYHSFLDVSHTRVFVYLPFCGWHELPTSEVMTTDNYTRVIKVDYIVDFITGGCRAVVYVNGIHKWDFDGNCGENIPLTSNDKGNADRNAFIGGITSFVGGIDSVAKGFAVGGYAGAIVSGIGATANTVVNSIPKYSYSSTGSYSGLIEACSPRNISFVIVRPDVQEPIGYAHKYGKPCHLVKRLGELKGFTSCVNPDFDSAYATESEKAEVISLLQSGIIL